MTPIDMHHAINRQLAQDLRDALRKPAFIQINTIEPERELVPLTRGLVESMAEALDLADRKITSLETMIRAVTGALREILVALPKRCDVGQVLTLLDSVDETLK